MNNFMLRDKKGIILATSLFTIAVLMISYQIYSYVSNISVNQKDLVEERLKEMTFQGANHARNIMKAYIDHIRGFAFKLSKNENINQDLVRDFLKDITRGIQFHLITVDILSGDNYTNGCSYTSDGDIVLNSDFSYFSNIKKNDYIVNDVIKSGFNNIKSIEIICPIEKNDKIIGAVRGALYVGAIGLNLTNVLFDGEGYSNLFDSNGEYLTFSDSNNVLLFQENYLEMLGKLSFDDGYSIDQVKDNIANRRQYFIAYSYYDQQRYSYSVPIDINRWYFNMVVPKWVIDKNTKELEQRAVSMASKVAFLLVLTLCVFIFTVFLIKLFNNNISRISEELLMKEKRFHFVFERSESILFEYVVADESIKFSSKFEELFRRKPLETKLPYGAIESGAVHPENAATFLKFFEDIKKGVPSISGELRLKDGLGKYVWCLVSAILIFNKKNIPVKCIGTVEIINDKKEMENKYNEILKYKSAIDSDNIFKCDINLTKNYYINGFEEILEKTNIGSENNYLKILRLMARDYFNIENMNEFMHKNNPNNLISLFLSGITDPAFEYRIVENGKAERWLYFKYKLYESPVTLDTCAIVSITDISERKRKEAELIDKAEKDQMTDLYNKTTTEKLIKEWIHSHENSTGVLMIIDIDNFKNVNDKLGHLYGDILLKSLAEDLKSMFRANDVVGRIGGDEFFVFLKKMYSEKIIIEKAKDVCELFHSLYEENGISYEISASIGIALFPKHGNTLDELYKNADTALYVSKEKEKNTYTIYSEESPDESDILTEIEPESIYVT